MNAKQAIKLSINTGKTISKGLLDDLTDAEMFHRPAPECNHINWQLGHLITAEHRILNKVAGGKMPDLPSGFEEKYAMDKTGSDDPSAFCSKAELLAVHEDQRAAGIAFLETLTDADFDKPSGLDWAPTLGAAVTAGAGAHWLMHTGQWTVVRRQLGRKPLF
jgi:hypothetical protein